MNRAIPAIVLCLAAMIAIVFMAPPQVQQNLTTYYKKLMQAPAVQMTFTARTPERRNAAPKPASQPAPRPVAASEAGPRVSVLGGITWERTTRVSSPAASHVQRVESAPPAVEAAVTGSEPEVPSTEVPAPAEE